MKETKILYNTWKELSCGNWVMIDGDDNGYAPVIAQDEEDIARGDYSEYSQLFVRRRQGN